MKKIMYMFVSSIACFLFVCCYKDKKPDEEDQRIIQIKSLTVGKKILSLEYKVINPFQHDIWICEDIDVYVQHQAETRIMSEKLTIRLRLDPDIDIFTEGVLAKYKCLSPEQSYSGSLKLELPIREFWAVRGFRDLGKERKSVILHRTLLEIGYFERDLLKVLSETIKKGMADPDYTFVLEEVQHKHSRSTAYLPHLWTGLRKQKSATVFIDDVDIPCSVVIEH